MIIFTSILSLLLPCTFLSFGDEALLLLFNIISIKSIFPSNFDSLSTEVYQQPIVNFGCC